MCGEQWSADNGNVSCTWERTTGFLCATHIHLHWINFHSCPNRSSSFPRRSECSFCRVHEHVLLKRQRLVENSLAGKCGEIVKATLGPQSLPSPRCEIKTFHAVASHWLECRISSYQPSTELNDFFCFLYQPLFFRECWDGGMFGGCVEVEVEARDENVITNSKNVADSRQNLAERWMIETWRKWLNHLSNVHKR